MTPQRRCLHPTCNTLIPFTESYCDKHKTYIHSSYNDIRQRNNPEYLRFYYSTEWKKARRQALLRDDYLCRRCGRIAQLVDHIIPTKEDWSLRLEQDNLQSLCNACHAAKTAEDGRKYR